MLKINILFLTAFKETF